MNLRRCLSALPAGTPIVYVLALAFVLRAGMALLGLVVRGGPEAFHNPDTPTYILPAEELLGTGQFAREGVPEVFRTPGYPLFLLPGIVLGHVELVTIVLQILVSCCTVYLVYRVVRQLSASGDVAALCALLYAVEPLSILYSSIVLTETLFTALLVASLFFLLRFTQHMGWGDIVLSGALCAAATYIRPVSYFLPGWIAIVLIVACVVQRREVRRLVLGSVVFVATATVPPVAWQARNAVVAGYNGISAITDINLYYYEAGTVLAAEQGVSLDEMTRQLGFYDTEVYLKLHPEQRAMTLVERYPFMRREGLKIVMGHPLKYAFARLKGTLNLLLNPTSLDYVRYLDLYPEFRRFGQRVERGGIIETAKGLFETALFFARHRPVLFWLSAVFGLYLMAIYVVSAVSIVCGKPSRSPATIVLLAALVYFVLIPGAVGNARFRHPVMPIVVIFAGHGLARITGWWRMRKRDESEGESHGEGA